jgi:TPR repeat protein
MMNILKRSGILCITLLILLFSSVAIANTNGFEEYDAGIRYITDKEYTLAIKYLKLSAEKGNVKAMKMLGSIYEKSTIVPQNLEESFRWYKKAVDAGSLEALVPLGVRYELGLGTQENKKLAFQAYKKAADNGIVEAYSRLGYVYLDGDIINKDAQEALKWFTKAYEANTKNKNKRDASKDAAAIGSIYYYGDGIPKDIVKAMQWYKTSVDLDQNIFNLMPSYNLGNIYYDRKEYKEALKYYRISSKQLDGKFVPANVAMGDMYFFGSGLEEPDYLIASKYYQKAVEQYSATHLHKKYIIAAMRQLGSIYYIGGYGIEKNIDTAKIWLRRASSLGDSTAKELLSTLE